VSTKVRSAMMRAVRQKHTKPELELRQILWRSGIRYRVNNKSLPGSPDVSNMTRRWAIFVNGCFWHGHKNCLKTKGGKGSRIPAANSSFWQRKILNNRLRDARNCFKLRSLGYDVLIIWECQLKAKESVIARLNTLVNK
jgi:DNA mismatch endonuclease, patch repair protein